VPQKKISDLSGMSYLSNFNQSDIIIRKKLTEPDNESSMSSITLPIRRVSFQKGEKLSLLAWTATKKSRSNCLSDSD
jgi:hypothetical protein